MFWKKPRGHHSISLALEDREADDGENRELSENTRSSKKPCVKQEESALKKPVEKCSWKLPRNASQDARSEAAGPGAGSESDQGDGHESPPKRKAMHWASAKSPAPMRKKKKVSLGRGSYVLVDVEDTKKKPFIPKKGPGLRRGASVQRAPRCSQPTESPASTSQGAKAKPEGSPHGENDNRSHLGCVNKQMKGEEQEWQVEADEPKGVAGHVASEEDPSAVEEVGDTPVEDLEGRSPDLSPWSP